MGGNLSMAITEKLDRVAERLNDIHNGKIHSLKKQLSKQYLSIRHRYKASTLDGATGKIDEWLCDNYYMIEKETKNLAKSLNNVVLPIDGSSTLPQIYLFVREAVFDQSVSITTENCQELIAILEAHRTITNLELDFLHNAIKISAIEGVYQAVLSDDVDLISRCIILLANVDNIDFDLLMEENNHLDKILSNDPARLYAQMNDQTKQIYRYKISKIALKTGKDELKLATEYIGQSDQHVGFVIYQRYKELFAQDWTRQLHIPLQIGLPVVLSALVAWLIGNLLWALVLYFPMWEIVRPLVERICLIGVQHEYAPRLDFQGIVPKTSQTMVVISTLLPDQKGCKELEQKLEKLYFTNKSEGISFCVLADLKQSSTPTLAEDEARINRCAKLITGLNHKYGSIFMLLVRKRTYSQTGQTYTGWERKRGAITELVRMIHGDGDHHQKFVGDKALLKQTKYILALDYDTKMLLEAASNLVAVAEHPLNRPKMDEKKQVVTSGYGIISPNVAVDLRSSLATPFARVMCGVGGVSSYETQSIDLYQDLHHEGIFSGKGLIDVAVFYKLLDNRFPTETVLSHDILEGSFLRTRFVSDVTLTDGFPPSATPYFKRLHRWIRGDFQNIPYLFQKMPTQDDTTDNPLNQITKFKLFDNLRRALSPCFSLTCLILAFFSDTVAARVFTLVGLLSALSPYVFGLLFVLIGNNGFAFSRKYYAKIMPKGFELISQSIYNLIFLPKFAYNAVDAATRAVDRRFRSRKNMLEWTTAAQTEKSKSNFKQLVATYWFSTLLGMGFLFSARGYLRLLGILFALTIPIVLYSARRYPKKLDQITDDQREDLSNSVAAMWNFYCDFAGESDHHLPPDNVQEAPVFRIAHRTSPTNIGFLLLSVLTARDFGLIDTAEMKQRLTKTIQTVEQLPKWCGNLYNWYDTKTLATLQPEYVSAVDSGNFVCCLVAVREGLQDYSLDGDFTELIDRMDRLIDDTDLSVFYDKNKKLFSIGYDCEAKKLSGSHYDMLMSEARMTSYFAIAKRQVPKKHWEFLSRTLARSNYYTGPVSWTGTMFEYFMPELLLHCAEGSLGHEALNFCLYCQKNRTKNKDIPFGISESAFYAFDTQLNYQYKAHGVQKLALKRGMNGELVISPYSSYLTLSHDFEASYYNLQWLKQIGAFGKYGHYEALDFTKSRIRNKNFALIKSYMAHHVGMSIVAANNALNNNIMQKRFLRNKYMSSASELLEEKIIEGSVLFEGIYKKENQPKSTRETIETAEYDITYPQSPRVKLLSNGELTSVLTDSGSCYLSYQGLDVTRRPSDLLRRPNGVFAAVKIENTIVPFAFAPDYHDTSKRTVHFENNAVSYFSRKKDLQVGMRVLLNQTIACEQRQFAIKNIRNQKRDVELMIYFEPVLSSFADDSAHPAFSKLFVNIGYDDVTNTITARRKQRKNEKQIFLAVGFLENCTFEYEACRENILERPSGIGSVFDGFDHEFNQGNGTPDPCIAIKCMQQLLPKEQKNLTLLLCVGNSEQEATQAVVSARLQEMLQEDKAAPAPIADHSIEGRLAAILLPQILFPKNDTAFGLQMVARNTHSVQILWQKGISGDLPIVAVEVRNQNDSDKISCYVSCQKLVSFSTIQYDLVFVCDEQDMQLSDMVRNVIKECAAEQAVGQRGGIFLLNKAIDPPELITALFAYSCHIAPKKMALCRDTTFEYTPVVFHPVTPVQSNVDFSKNSFFIDHSTKLPWSHLLANPQFGTLLSDKSLGFTWAVNSRECKITPWYNDTMSDNRGELLVVKVNDQYYDLINGAATEFNPNYAKYRAEFKGIKSCVTVRVATKGMKKMVELTLENTENQPLNIALSYYTEPALYVDRSRAKQIKFGFENDLLLMHNPANFAVKSFAGLYCSSASHAVVSRPAFLCGRWGNERLSSCDDPCAALIVEKKLPPKRTEKVDFVLAFASSERGVKEQLHTDQNSDRTTQNIIQINTPDQTLNHLFNTWLPWQTTGARMFARTGFYQCGGAYGFRDQLQDSCAAVLLDPHLTKYQITRACSSQFEEGDVLHWWHMLPAFGGGKKGVRTRYSDDLVWLPYTVCEYIEKTQDKDLLTIRVSYCTGDLLLAHEHEKYLTVGQSEYKAAVYEHCVRALDKAYHLGEHGLPLMGCGDWNDGYNMVGAEGRGESVWLAQFLSLVLNRFAPICNLMGDSDRTTLYQQRAEQLLQAVHTHCWDGNWYLRAFFDNGEPMGASSNRECTIDSLPQSFSIIADMPDQERNQTALNSAYNRLFDRDAKIIQLFENPFDHSDQHPGYVKSYPVGVRENGGQYTHAAVWMAMAMLKSGDAQRGYALMQALNPAEKYSNEQVGSRYKLEPYYMAADIYTNPSAFGRGGWSIYTGAAGWYYRTILEYLIGIRVKNNQITVTPCLPEHWDQLSATMCYQNTTIDFAFEKKEPHGLHEHGQLVDAVPLDQQIHQIKVYY